MHAPAACVASTVIFAGRYSGASLAWKACGPMTEPAAKRPPWRDVTNARFVAPAMFAGVHFLFYY